MRSEHIGTGTSGAEILNDSPHGFWLMVREREYNGIRSPWFSSPSARPSALLPREGMLICSAHAHGSAARTLPVFLLRQ
jgi:hypothetical protein